MYIIIIMKLSFCSFPNCLLMCSVKVQIAKKFLPRGRILDMRKELWLSSLSIFYFWRIPSRCKYHKQEHFHFVFHYPIILYSSNEAFLYYTRHRTQKLIAPRFKFCWNCIHTTTTINEMLLTHIERHVKCRNFQEFSVDKYGIKGRA